MRGGQLRSAVLRGLVTLRGDGAETEHEAGYTLPAIAGKILATHRLAGLEHLVCFEPGDELARFEFGSTAILLLPPGGPPLMPGFQAGRTVRLGEKLAISCAERGRL